MEKTITPSKAFAQAVEAVGGPAAAARIIGYTPQKLNYWIKEKKECPPDGARKLAIGANKAWRTERAEQRTSAKLLRPDLY